MKFSFFLSFGQGIILLVSLFIFGCSSDGDSNPISSNFGEFITLPNFDESTDLSLDLIATNNGLYISVDNTIGNDEKIYRYDLNQNSILSGTWQNWVYNTTTSGDRYAHITPLNFFSETTSEHHLFITPNYYAFQTPVYNLINMGNGSVIAQENAPTHDFNPSDMGSYGKIIKDVGQDWAVFRGGQTGNNNQHVIKRRVDGQNFSQVCTVTADGELLYAPSFISTDLLALSYQNKKLFIIKPGGQIIELSLANFYDGAMAALDYKTKFRFSSSDTYFLFQNKVLKLDGNQSVTLFHTIPYLGGTSGDFCVDNDYMFATDGTRKELSGFYNEINIIPPPPSTTNQELLINYIEKTNFFKIGEIETSTNPDDNYIYILGAYGKILVVSKYYN